MKLTIGAITVCITSLVLAVSLAHSDAPTVRADGEGGVMGVGCEQIEVTAISGECPPAGGPQRDDPWLPTIQLPSPDDDLGADCGSISVTIDHIGFHDCPPTGKPYDQPILAFDGSKSPPLRIPSPAPDYDGEYDAVPIRLCWAREDVPSTLFIFHPEHERAISTGRATVYCCDDC